MKRLIYSYIIFFSFILLPAHATQKLDQKQLKEIRGQSGIVFELNEMTVRLQYGTLTYEDTDGFGSITNAGVKVISDDNMSVLHFKPIEDFEKYSNENLKEIFGEKIGKIGLIENPIKNHNAYINRFKQNKNDELEYKPENVKEKNRVFSHLSIETTDLCTLLQAIQLFNTGSTSSINDNLTQQNLKMGGIVVNLPSVETEIGGWTKEIVIFSSDPSQQIKNNNKLLFTLEKGTSKSAIFSGRIEIKANDIID